MKQIRCINCNNIIASGYIKEGTIEIDCRHCKTKNKMVAVQGETTFKPYGEGRELKTKVGSTLAMIGEKGRENVIPLNKLKDI
jgi:phage FluMu protein Com